MSQCAQEGQLSGGPRDTIPPHIIYTIPKKFDTNYTAKKITIKFNEFFQLKNINNQFFSSIPLSKKPKFKIKGKKLIIIFPDKLKDSTTYYLYFGNSIADFNEGNILKNFSFIFSTYNKIDSLKISGKVIDAKTLKPLKDIIVGAYEASKGIQYNKIPDYCAKTDSAGNFSLQYLKPQKYYLIAFKDLNDNYTYDGFPENIIGFIDSTITPKIKIDTIIDTLPAGSIIKINDTLLDTLKQDSITITLKTQFLPQNIEIRTFQQLQDTQYIKSYERILKGQLIINFAKPINKNSLNFTLFPTTKNIIKEFYPKSDSVVLWITDSTVYNSDTIKALVSYPYKDNKITDTLIFYDYDKQKDTSNLEIEIPKKLLPTDTLSITFYSLIQNIDTNKIKLYQIIDTIPIDLKKQKVLVKRVSYNKLIINFSRPIIKNIKLDFKNIQNDSLYYRLIKKDNKHFEVNLLNDSLIHKDTLTFTLHYDNLYFFNELQKLSKQFKVFVERQKISFKRTENKHLIFTAKNPTNEFYIQIKNLPDSLYSIQKTEDSIIVNLKKNFYDTIICLIKAYDYTLNNKKFYITDTIKSIYKYQGNPLIKALRYQKNKIKLIFKDNLQTLPKIKILNSIKHRKKWYRPIFLNNHKDTLFLLITDNRIKRQKNLKILLKWYAVNEMQDTFYHQDTLNLKVISYNISKQVKTNTITSSKDTNKKITLLKPLKYHIEKIKKPTHKILIFNKLYPKNSYKIKIDSCAFQDIFLRTNDTISFTIKITDTSNFIKPKIIVKNIGKLTNSADTSKIKTGQIIISLYDLNEKKLYSVKTKKDTIFYLPPIEPNNYKIKILFDKNNDEKYTPGNIETLTEPEPIWFLNALFKNEDTITINFKTLLKK